MNAIPLSFVFNLKTRVATNSNFLLGDLGNLSATAGSLHPSEIDSTRATLGDSSPSTISLSSLMNADDGTAENEENDNPDIECDFDAEDEGEPVLEGGYSPL